MKKLLYIFILSFIVSSCTSNTIYEKPKDLIPKDTMISLLTDMFIASSAKNYKNLSSQKNINYTFLVYKKYKIDSVRFQNSNLYYTSKIDEYEKMILEVESMLINKKDSLVSIKKNIDSINTIKYFKGVKGFDAEKKQKKNQVKK